MSPNLCVNSGEFTLQSVQKKVLDNLHIKSLMYSSSRPAAAVTIQLLFWTHFLREHKGTVLTKRNDLHQLAGCALIHTENHVKWEIARESSARRSTGTVSMWVSGFGATHKQSLETVCWNKRFISVAWEGPITRIHTDTYAHTHTHTLFFTFFWIQQRQYRH